MIMGRNRIFTTQKFLNIFSWINFSDEFSCDKLFKSGDVCDADRWRFTKKEELPGSIHDLDNTLHHSVHRVKRLVLPEVDRKLAEERHSFGRRNSHQCLLLGDRPVTLSTAQASTAKLSSIFARNQPPTATSAKLRNNLR